MVFIRQSLELPTISGRDAKFLVNIQTRLEDKIIEIEKVKEQEEQKKQKVLKTL
jgi:hypothetical protein